MSCFKGFVINCLKQKVVWFLVVSGVSLLTFQDSIYNLILKHFLKGYIAIEMNILYITITGWGFILSGLIYGGYVAYQQTKQEIEKKRLDIEEARRKEKEANKPVIELSVCYEVNDSQTSSVIKLVIGNKGKTTAQDVSFNTDGDTLRDKFNGELFISDVLLVFEQTPLINLLHPKESITKEFGVQLNDDRSTWKDDSVIDIDISYSNTEGDEYTHNQVLSINPSTTEVKHKTETRTANTWEELKELAEWTNKKAIEMNKNS